MFSIDVLQLEELSRQGNMVSLAAQIPSDTETPISLYYKLCKDRTYSFLLESAEQDARMGRYSFIGFDPLEIFKFDEGDKNPLEMIRAAMDKIQLVEMEKTGRFESGFVGYFSYEVMRHFEKISMPAQASASGIPESIFYLPRVVIVFDHIKHKVYLHYLMSLEGDLSENLKEANVVGEEILQQLAQPMVVPFLRNPKSEIPANVELNPSRNDFIEQVAVAKSFIESGDIFQVVLSHSMEAKTEKSPLELYRALRQENPSPYMYLMQFEDFAVVGASPETLVRLEDGNVLVRPIAGTRHRGVTTEEDKQLEEELKNDPKERAEHMMLVDLGRNDVGRVAKQGTVTVPEMAYVQRFSSVMHLVSDVSGIIRDDKDMFDVFEASFPAGTLSGAPKIRAAEIIASLERRQRGIYGGAVGYFGLNGNMDFAIAIRTLIHKNGTAYVQAGAGVVYDSIPQKEHEECFHKAAACLSVL
jgi:anthranilate synthase component I